MLIIPAVIFLEKLWKLCSFMTNNAKCCAGTKCQSRSGLLFYVAWLSDNNIKSAIHSSGPRTDTRTFNNWPSDPGSSRPEHAWQATEIHRKTRRSCPWASAETRKLVQTRTQTSKRKGRKTSGSRCKANKRSCMEIKRSRQASSVDWPVFSSWNVTLRFTSLSFAYTSHGSRSRHGSKSRNGSEDGRIGIFVFLSSPFLLPLSFRHFRPSAKKNDGSGRFEPITVAI